MQRCISFYLHGYMIGIPALMLIQVLGPMIVMDGGKKLFSLSAAALCVVDVIGDLLNAFVFHGGSFGMGLATSVAFMIQLAMLLGRFFRAGSYSTKNMSKTNQGEVNPPPDLSYSSISAKVRMASLTFSFMASRAATMMAEKNRGSFF